MYYKLLHLKYKIVIRFTFYEIAIVAINLEGNFGKYAALGFTPQKSEKIEGMGVIFSQLLSLHAFMLY